jgi:hypothetical protein
LEQLRFHPVAFPDAGVLSTVGELVGVGYSLVCRTPRNNYQLDSTFDAAMKHQLVSRGAREVNLGRGWSGNLDLDFALDFHGQTVVFEIEKANKEKLLYDFLKMHIYLDRPEVSAALLVVPINWPHAHGVVDLFSFARERFDLCVRHGMADPAKTRRMLIVGFSQLYQGRSMDDRTLGGMKQACKAHFDSLATALG